jgi:hypothetical protein
MSASNLEAIPPLRVDPLATLSPISVKLAKRRTNLVHCCARYCMLPEHRERTSLYLKEISLVLHVLGILQVFHVQGKKCGRDQCVMVGSAYSFRAGA